MRLDFAASDGLMIRSEKSVVSVIRERIIQDVFLTLNFI